MASVFTRYIKGIVVKPESSDPSDNLEGSIFANSSSNRIKTYIEGAVREFVTADQTQTLTNKTLTSPTITSPTLTVTDSGFTIQDNGDATKQAKFELSSIATGTTRTFTLPNASTTVVGTDATQTISNKTIDSTNSITVLDTNLFIPDNSDPTKRVQFAVSASQTTGTDITLTAPSGSTTLVGTDSAQTLTNKTINASANTISNITNGNISLTADIARSKIASDTVDRIPFNHATTGYLDSSVNLRWKSASQYLIANGSMALGSTSDPTITGLDIVTGGLRIQSFTTAGPVISSGTGVLSTEAQLSTARGGTGQDLSASTGALYATAGTISAGTLAVSNGGTGATSLTSNGVILGNGTSALSAVTGSAYQPLRIPSGGGAPAFGALDISQSAAVTGILTVSNGGTGASSLTNNGVVMANGTSALTAITGSAYQPLRVPSGGGAATFGALDISQAAAVTGLLSTTNGGTGQNFSASTGVIKVASGTMSAATIVNADISASAAIDRTKLANLSVVTKTANYTAATSDDVIIYTSGTSTLTLYAASGNTGKRLYIKNSGAGVITIDANASETIDGNLTYVLSNQYDSVTLICDGTNWQVQDEQLNGYVSSTSSLTALPAAAGAWGDSTSITLTPGSWMIGGHAIFYSDAVTTTGYCLLGISTTSGNSATGLTFGDNYLTLTKRTTSDSRDPLTITPYRVTVTSNTTYYLKTQAETSTTNLRHAFRLSAWRI